jgi:hypothetical protein
MTKTHLSRFRTFNQVSHQPKKEIPQQSFGSFVEMEDEDDERSNPPREIVMKATRKKASQKGRKGQTKSLEEEQAAKHKLQNSPLRDEVKVDRV